MGTKPPPDICPSTRVLSPWVSLPSRSGLETGKNLLISLLYWNAQQTLRRLASYYALSNFYCPRHAPLSLHSIILLIYVCVSTACLGMFYMIVTKCAVHGVLPHINSPARPTIGTQYSSIAIRTRVPRVYRYVHVHVYEYTYLVRVLEYTRVLVLEYRYGHSLAELHR